MTLVVIGGGSVNWMRGLMRDIYLLDESDGGEIRLVDPNRQHVEAVAGMLAVFNTLRGKEYKISIVDDRRAALDGADFVLTTFSPGSLDAFWNDLELPIKYGIRQPVSMTVGIPGISASLRTAPIAYEIVQDMEAMCPGAWLLNVTNPMSTTTRAMNLAAKTIKVIGMCHEFHALPNYLGPMLGLYRPDGMSTLTYLYKWLSEQSFSYTVAGLNHFIWLTKADYRGQDVLPVIRGYADTHQQFIQPGKNPDHQAVSVWGNNGEAKLAMCRQFGFLPLAGDRHLVEFYPSLCNVRNGYAMKYNVHKTTVDARRMMKQEQLQDILSISEGKNEGSWTSSGEEMIEIIKAIVTNRQTTSIVNLPNQGQVSNIQTGAVVETLAVISADGIRPIDSGTVPGAAGSLCRLHADVHDLTVQAALSGDRKRLVEAISLDPSSGCADFSELTDLADDLVKANKAWLPRFWQ